MYGTILIILIVAFLPQYLRSSSVHHVWDNLDHTHCCILTSVSAIQLSAPCMGQSWSHSLLHSYLSICDPAQWPCMGQSWSYSLLHSYLSICDPAQCTMYGTILIIFFVAFLPQYLRSSSVHHVWDNLDHTHCCILTSVSAIQLSAPCMGQSWSYSLLHSYLSICILTSLSVI